MLDPRSPVLMRFDRHLRLASKVSGDEPQVVQQKFLRHRVLVTGDADYLSTADGRLTLLTALNLICRFCPRIDVDLGDLDALTSEVVSLLNSIDRSDYASFRPIAGMHMEAYDATLVLGRDTVTADARTNVVGRGWLAAVSSRGPAPELPAASQNPFGPLLAATLGAAEVFKWLVNPIPGKASFFDPTILSTYSYETLHDHRAAIDGPSLPDHVELPQMLIAGAGAVGNAFAYALALVPGIEGVCDVIDRETLDDDSNLNRYCLATEDDVHGPTLITKAQLVKRAFDPTAIRATPHRAEIETFLPRIFERKQAHPVIVVSAVDNNVVRPSLQRLWPNLLIEGATGDSIAQVSRHSYADGLACLMCIHNTDTRGPAEEGYADVSSGESGLAPQRIAEALRDDGLEVTEEDVRNAPDHRKPFLQERVGRPICSVLGEVAQLTSEPDEVPAEATVSFVSMAAGLFAAAEVVKWATAVGTGLETIFYFDTFFPLDNAVLQPVERGSECECTTRKNQIGAYRAHIYGSK